MELSAKRTLLVAVCLVALACFVSANSDCKRKLPQKPNFVSFDKFKEHYKKKYDSPEEEAARKKLYEERVEWARIVWDEFVDGLRSTYLSINRMSDWTDDELKTLNPKWEGLSRKRRDVVDDVSEEDDEKDIKVEFVKDEDQPEVKTSSLSKSEALAIQNAPPAKRRSRSGNVLSFMCGWTGHNSVKYNLNKSKCFSQILHQGHCASDYILTAISLYEYIYCKQEVFRRAMSEQYLLDCGSLVGLNGCKGANSFKDVTKFANVMGLEFASDYGRAFKAAPEKCKYKLGDKEAGSIKTADTEVVAVQPADFEHYLKQKVPVYVTVAVDDEFEFYKGGVADGDGCETNRGRAMLLVGSGIEDGSEYWLLRGTLGRDWGQEGHFKLNKQNKCMMGPGYVPARSGTSLFLSSKKHLFDYNKHHPEEPYTYSGSSESGSTAPMVAMGLGF